MVDDNRRKGEKSGTKDSEKVKNPAEKEDTVTPEELYRERMRERLKRRTEIDPPAAP